MEENRDETITAITEDQQNDFLLSARDFESLCFKILRVKVAKPHIFYKTTVVVAKKCQFLSNIRISNL